MRRLHLPIAIAPPTRRPAPPSLTTSKSAPESIRDDEHAAKKYKTMAECARRDPHRGESQSATRNPKSEILSTDAYLSRRFHNDRRPYGGCCAQRAWCRNEVGKLDWQPGRCRRPCR